MYMETVPKYQYLKILKIAKTLESHLRALTAYNIKLLENNESNSHHASSCPHQEESCASDSGLSIEKPDLNNLSLVLKEASSIIDESLYQFSNASVSREDSKSLSNLEFLPDLGSSTPVRVTDDDADAVIQKVDEVFKELYTSYFTSEENYNPE
ncbi:unnamed protein product [Gordionus sp. m RMFG-2023]|uniref:uncharacterized protein LOC135922282 n=1 Tax=Gordionus sp. m RMFG-2023 TaxID=3053472 RepID=UPI0030E2E096